MSSIKIRDLPEKIDNLNDEDLMVIEDIEDTKKISLIKLRSAFSMDGILTATKNMLVDKINSFTETHSAKYKELLSKNNQLEITLHNLENDHIHDAERIFELEDRLVKQTDIISNLQQEKNRLLKLLSELQLDKDKLAEQIISLEKQSSDDKKSIVILKSQVKDLQIKSNELKLVNEELNKLITEYEKESNDKIHENFNEANIKLSESIEDLISYIRYYHPDVDDIFKEV